MRTRIMNQLQAIAMNEGQRRKKKLWNEQGRAQLEKLPSATWASRRRKDLLELLDRMNPTIEELTRAIEQEAKKRPAVLRLMTHPGVGPLTALAFVLIIGGTPERFKCGKQIGSYVGLIPCEDSSAGHQRLGHITKQGSSLLRFLLGKQRKLQRVGIRTGGDGMYTWRYAGKGTSPRWPWPEGSRFGCTGCGGTVGNIQSGSSLVRTRDSSVPGMA
jgi:transposase